MSSRIARLRGTTTALYCPLNESEVLLVKEVDNYYITRLETFNSLYFKLSDTVVALKEDCIEYVVYRRRNPLYMYPNWYVQAVVDGIIFDDGYGYGGHMFYDESGEMAISEGSYILRNFMGELRYMEHNDFTRHYEVTGGMEYGV